MFGIATHFEGLGQTLGGAAKGIMMFRVPKGPIKVTYKKKLISEVRI